MKDERKKNDNASMLIRGSKVPAYNFVEKKQDSKINSKIDFRKHK